MKDVTPQDIRELQQAISRLNSLNERYDHGSWMSAEQFTTEWKAADQQYRAASENLQSKGIEDELHLENAVAKLANPQYQEPHSLGCVVVDDVDLDYDFDAGIN